MSTLTGNDVYGLMEAYQAVYAPQELTEEQVWEEVENWVNSLLEEGYDLSEYTWEEMYEAYLNEDLMGDLRANAGNIVRGATGAYQGAMRTASNVNQALVNRIKPKPSPTFQNTGGFGRYAPPSAQVKTPAARTPAAPAPAARTPAAPAPAARPAATTPAAPKVTPKPAAATPSGGSALDRATAAASKPAAFSPKPQSDVGAMIARSQARQSAQTPKPAAAAARPMGGARERMLNQSFDPFDIIKGHLIDEGYADTEEQALAIMANMSEEWRESIVEGMVDFLPKSTTVIPGKYGKNTVLSKKGGVEGVSDKSKPGSFTPQKGGFDKMDAERYATQHSKQGTSSGTSGINLAGRRETSGRVK